ncbi:CotS family spore coat protein [Brevibacillus porteri]|uniref:CotS family spore coat protein n=1 Tax=Brevibacillus porteri TaxID=2126350 RepID=A0ABX5FV97_9BACL|nr:CotS family spore coat protein [Brevibacillus porteri]MED1798487.1 CotS family spore coat protein [Brevibacillus porteri]MED2129224.1 CotS family spore coat protein [Brevibacillus porteri]MED2748473.1 CotS family spore coat protein [Brevibacillus porteri]MED2816880.1 CotS family spore coat protein [Brevibacillus porteri]MED2895985.1 CotS family spore coat protein [Brevibacillus porteri]
MEQYVIKPWDTREGNVETPANWDMTVPPEVDAIAEQVIKEYDMSVKSRTLITSKPDKGGAIWRIETDKGPRSLKVLHRTPERSLYSVAFQEYVVKQGARVPALIPARNGSLFVEKGGKLWIVTDWIALQPATKVDLVGAQELCYGLGEFHRHSKGYIPPAGAKNSSRLYRWPNHYQKIAKKIGWMREVAKAYSETPTSKSILAVVDHYEQQAWAALEKLKTSSYPKMIKMGEAHWGLVHQDYGWSNGQNGPGGLWVIDLDGVSYDLPFRDLRKLITSTMDDMGVWDVTWMRGMIEAYHKANPLDRESFEVLLNDMAVPNEFYKHLKEMFYDPAIFLSTEAEGILQRVLTGDKTKDAALAELAKDISKYEPGNYDQITEVVEPQRLASGIKDFIPVAVSTPPTESLVEVLKDEESKSKVSKVKESKVKVSKDKESKVKQPASDKTPVIPEESQQEGAEAEQSTTRRTRISFSGNVPFTPSAPLATSEARNLVRRNKKRGMSSAVSKSSHKSSKAQRRVKVSINVKAKPPQAKPASQAGKSKKGTVWTSKQQSRTVTSNKSKKVAKAAKSSRKFINKQMKKQRHKSKKTRGN